MAEIRVLVADDDSSMLDLMIRRLGRMGLQADRAPDGTTALEMIEVTSYDLILTDIYMPGGTGLDIIRKAKEKDPHVQVVVATGSATLDNAVDALNEGAFSYLTKPFDHLSVFDNAVSRALEFRRLIRDNQRLAQIQRRRGDMLEAEVTERIRQMRRKQQDLVDLLARLPQGLVVVDTDGRALMSNALAEKWLAQEAREPTQPLRRYLSSVTPPRRPTTTEILMEGLSLHLTAQALPEADGKGRTLVVIEEEREGPPTGILRSSLAKLRPGLEWLTRQVLNEKETEVVRLLSMQVAAIERMLRADQAAAGPVQPMDVDWKGVDVPIPAASEEAGTVVSAASGVPDASTPVLAPAVAEAPVSVGPDLELAEAILSAEGATSEVAAAPQKEAHAGEAGEAKPAPPGAKGPKAPAGVLRRLKSRREPKPEALPQHGKPGAEIPSVPVIPVAGAPATGSSAGEKKVGPAPVRPQPKKEEELSLSESLEALREEERLASGGVKLKVEESSPSEPPPVVKKTKGNGSGGERPSAERHAKVWPPPLPSEVEEE